MSDSPTETWPFGMAPPLAEMQKRLEASCWNFLSVLSSFLLPEWSEKESACVNEVEGLFRSVAQQDTRDWLIIADRLGYPSARLSAIIAKEIHILGAAIRQKDRDEFANARAALVELPTRRCLYALLKWRKITDELGGGWIYMLANRAVDDLISVGMTTGKIERRIEDINRVSSAENAFGLSRCWRVSDPTRVARLMAETLSGSFVQDDDGRFHAPALVAGKILDAAIAECGFEVRTLDALGSLGEPLWGIFNRHSAGEHGKASSRH